ncbi:MAG: hypothetical protein ACQEQV_00775 [Fibrobacterota bacterium]
MYFVMSAIIFIIFASAYHGRLPRFSKKNTASLSLTTLEDTLQTGDILLFHGKSIFNKAASILSCGSPWGHVAMVYRRPDGSLCLWESNIKKDSVREVLCSDCKDGPMLTDFRERISASDKLIALRRIGSQKASLKIAKSIRKLIDAHYSEHIPTGLEVALSAHMGKYLHHCPDNGIYCSQLVARTLMHAGIISSRRRDNWFTPADFGSETTLHTMGSVTYSREEYFRIHGEKAALFQEPAKYPLPC